MRAERDLSQTNSGVPDLLDPLVALIAPDQVSADVDLTRGDGSYRVF
jgi:hypothetical protein